MDKKKDIGKELTCLIKSKNKLYYPGYQFLFLFDNITSHTIYSKDALRVSKMNKSIGRQQPFLRDDWFEKNVYCYLQTMNFLKQDSLLKNGVIIQKRVQIILQEQDLWPTGGLNFAYPIPECSAYYVMTKCKDCIKESRCISYMEKKTYSSKCTPKRACNKYCQRKKRCL